MGKKRYFDEKGNEVRSKPPNGFYQQWWFKLLILTIIGVFVFIGIDLFNEKESEVIETLVSEPQEDVNNNPKDNDETIKVVEENEDETISNHEDEENGMEEPEFTYDDFKGTYVTFEGVPYESAIIDIVFLEDNSLRNGSIEEAVMNVGMIFRKIIDRTIEGNTLKLDYIHTSEASNEPLHIILEHHNNFKSILVENDSLLNQRFYSISQKELIEYYDPYEIDYARIIMMTGIPRVDPSEPIIYVNNMQSGTPIFDIEGSPKYPETVMSLMSLSNSFSNHDVYSTVYSAQGDGYITLYPQPSNFELNIELQNDEHYHNLAYKILDNSETVYVAPSEPYLVADFIARVEFYYQ